MENHLNVYISPLLENHSRNYYLFVDSMEKIEYSQVLNLMF